VKIVVGRATLKEDEYLIASRCGSRLIDFEILKGCLKSSRTLVVDNRYYMACGSRLMVFDDLNDYFKSLRTVVDL